MENTIKQIKDVVSSLQREDGWAEMAAVGAMLNNKEINIKSVGFSKLKMLFDSLTTDFKVSIDSKTNLPLVMVISNEGDDVVIKETSMPQRNTMMLTNWANINLKSAIESLSIMALPERWSYCEENEEYPKPILAKYLKWTFVKLIREDKVLYSGRFAAFNTGLVDKFYKPIFAVFDKNKFPKQPWHFIDFCVAGSSTTAARILTDNFSTLPERALYINQYDDVMYDCNLPVDGNWEHIILENIERMPMELISQICSGLVERKDTSNLDKIQKKECYEELKSILTNNPIRLSLITNMMTMAVEMAKARVTWNYKTAIPVYYPTDDKVHLILPLSLNIKDPDQISLALVMTKTPSNRYRAVTIFTLDMAYSNARLITKPSSDWLVADSILA